MSQYPIKRQLANTDAASFSELQVIVLLFELFIALLDRENVYWYTEGGEHAMRNHTITIYPFRCTVLPLFYYLYLFPQFGVHWIQLFQINYS